jgi:Flp pilus assembly protein TadG
VNAPAGRRIGRHEELDEGAEAGNAIVEFIFVALLVLVPLVYLIVAVAQVQSSGLSVTNAARDVGRAIATTPDGTDPQARADAALRIALDSHGLKSSDVEVRYVAASAECSSAAITPLLGPGSEFAVCVTRHQVLPGIPTILSGRGVTTVGRYVVHLDEFRTTG